MFTFQYSPLRTTVDKLLPKEILDTVLATKSFYYTKWDDVRKRKTTYPIKKSVDWNFFDLEDFSFPSGFLSRVCNTLTEMNEDFEIVPIVPRPKQLKSTFRSSLAKFYETTGISPRYFQKEAVEAVATYDTGIIEIGTGGGKTLFYGMLIAQLNVQTFVITIDLTSKQQTYEELCSMLGSENVGQIDWKDYDRFPVVVANVQNCWAKYEDAKFIHYAQSVGLLIVNECHHINESAIRDSLANTWYKITTLIPAWYRVGATGTTGNLEAFQGYLFRAALGEVLYSKKTQELIKEGFATSIEVHVYPYKSANEESANATTAYKNLTEEEGFNPLIASLALKYADEGKKVAVFCEWHKNQLNVLEVLLGDKAVSVSGKTKKGQDRTDKFRDFAEGKYSILIGTVFNEDINIPAIDVGIILGKFKNERKIKQRTGRVARLFQGKEKGIIVVPLILDRKLVNRVDKMGKSYVEVQEGLLTRHCKDGIAHLRNEGHTIINKALP